ncbi:MAG: acyl-CoA carboxylase subunit beta, partial [Knoellia sp.]
MRSTVDPSSATFAAFREANLAKLGELETHLDAARAGGGERYVDRHRARGRLTARERIELLLDEDAPFLELAP